MRAIVTGAARGLGAGVAARLARDGASVVLVDVLPEVIDTAKSLQQPGDTAIVSGIIADVSDEKACEMAISEALHLLGGVDALVNNAGIGGPDTTGIDTSLPQFWRVLEVNLIGTFLAARAAAKAMIEQGTGGAVVNVGSIFGQQGVPCGAAYCASKAGVALLTHSLALELARHGIRVNTIAPGNMATEMVWEELRSRAASSRTSFSEEVERLRQTVPLGRLGNGEDIAGAVAWLISDDASYVTGQSIGVNGGVLLT
jgi:NAD(P)-dependent dehydrogenase (short-subunit alcohol dehydrogenase family)